MKRWPLFLIALPAAVAIWSGWVGLGGLCGFGIVHPLPGIVPGFQLNTAITLPIGVEAYGAYALGAWLSPGTEGAARTFARRSAIGALALGMAGQVAFHLLAAAGATRAPWPVVVAVSCMPVVTLGFGAALTHLLRAEQRIDLGPAAPGEQLIDLGPADPAELPEDLDRPGRPEQLIDLGPVPAPAITGAETAAAEALARSVAGGNPLSQNALQARFRLSRAEAAKVRQAVLAESNGHNP